MSSIKQYACKNCGHPFDACPPDGLYVLPMRNKCVVYSAKLANCLIVQKYECENCDQTTILHWHVDSGHPKYLFDDARVKLKERLDFRVSD